MTLAEIIAEARKLDESATVAIGTAPRLDACVYRDRFRVQHFPRLARVAEAAVDHASEVRQTTQLESESGWYASRAPRLLRDVQKFLAAFDAAVRGEEETNG